MRAELARRFRAVLSGSPTGVPAWTDQILAGDDLGHFGPADAPWVVHADLATMIGGIRALLLQALHPGSLAGVAQHSRYESAALERLAGTIRWLTIATFGSKQALQIESERVNGMHGQVRGKYRSADGAERSYSATDSDLLLWVHIAFTDSFLRAHQTFGAQPIPGGADAYVGPWGVVVEPLGLRTTPGSLAELEAQIAQFQPILRVDERTARVVEFIKRPPLPGAGRIIYRLLFAAALTTLSEPHRQLLGLRVRTARVVVPVTKLLLFALRKLLGPSSPLEEAALARRERLQRLAAQ